MSVAALGLRDEPLDVRLNGLCASLSGRDRSVADEVLAQVRDDVALVCGRAAQARALGGLRHSSVS